MAGCVNLNPMPVTRIMPLHMPTRSRAMLWPIPGGCLKKLAQKYPATIRKFLVKLFSKKLRGTSPFWKKATPKNFYYFFVNRLFSNSFLKKQHSGRAGTARINAGAMEHGLDPVQTFPVRASTPEVMQPGVGCVYRQKIKVLRCRLFPVRRHSQKLPDIYRMLVSQPVRI